MGFVKDSVFACFLMTSDEIRRFFSKFMNLSKQMKRFLGENVANFIFAENLIIKLGAFDQSAVLGSLSFLIKL